MNMKTSYLDLNWVYGYTKQGEERIRRFGFGKQYLTKHVRFVLSFVRYIISQPYIEGGRLVVRDTTPTNHWNVCIQHFIPMSCKHQSNLD